MDNQLSTTIKSTIDLADYVRSCGIELKRHGRNDLKGLCPFHDDHHPSLIITPSKQLFHCPACGAGGSVIDFAAKLHQCSISEAIKELAKNTAVPAAKIKNINIAAAIKELAGKSEIQSSTEGGFSSIGV